MYVSAHEIDLVYVSTHEQVANIFTKLLGAEKMQSFQAMLGVHEFGLSVGGVLEHQAQRVILQDDGSLHRHRHSLAGLTGAT